MNSIPTIETERLRLRAYRLSDFGLLADFFATDRAQYVGGPLDRAAAWRGFTGDVGQWHLLGFGPWTIEEKQSGRAIGQVGINFPEDFPERELGWILWGEFEGKGFAMEAAIAARQFAFKTLDWETLVSYIDPRNVRSIKLAERMGAAYDAQALTPNGDACLVYRHKR